MAVSTHRLIILILALNLLVGFVVDTYHTPRVWQSDNTISKVDIAGKFVQAGTEGETSYSLDETYSEETTYTDTTKRSKSLFGLFFKGITAITYDFTTETQMEEILITSLTWFVTITNLLAFVQLYILLKNKATG